MDGLAIFTKALYTLCPIYSQFTSFTDYNSNLAYALFLSQTEKYQGKKIRDGFEECILYYAKEAQKSILNQEEKKEIDTLITILTQDVVK